MDIHEEGEMIHGSHSKAKGSNISDKDSPTVVLECWSEIMYPYLLWSDLNFVNERWFDHSDHILQK
jgi:hypothetical protein